MPTYDVISQASGSPVGDSVTWQDGVRLPKKWFHPRWLSRATDWRLFRLCYVGGREFLESSNPITLHSHERESKPSYADRRRRATYRNHCETIIGTKSDAIYQPQVLRGQKGVKALTDETAEASASAPAKPLDAPPRITRRQESDDTFEAFLQDVDGCGTNADPFWNDVSHWAMAQGVRWVEIRMASAPELEARAKAEGRLVSESEAREARLGAVLASVPAEAVIDWDTDERGRLKYALVLCREESRAPLLGQREEAPARRLIARLLLPDREERYVIGRNNGREKIGTFFHKFGEVPLVKVTVRPDERSEIEDIAPMNVAVFNYDSCIDEQVFRQTFNQLTANVKDPAKFQDMVSGTDALICLGIDEKIQFLAPLVQTIETVQRRADQTVDEMYAIANLRSRPGGGKGAQPAVDVSGVAYAFEHKNAETDLAGTAQRLEEAEQKILRMRARALGLPEDGVTVQYPREFDIRALQARAAEARALRDAGFGPKAMAEVLKGLVKKALPRLPAGKIAELEAEIDATAAQPHEAAAQPGQKPMPPNQAMQPPGKGAGEDRMGRAVKVGARVRRRERAA